MTAKTLSMFLSLALGSIFITHGITARSGEIINRAAEVVNAANLHQLATVIEVYYADQGHYPEAQNGEQLVSVLEQGNYILNRPLDSKLFDYKVMDNGENYHLVLKDCVKNLDCSTPDDGI